MRSPRVQAYLADTRALTAADVEAALGLLSSEERARHDRLALAPDRRDYVASRALLRLVLAAHAGRPAGELEIAADAHGKPSLASVPGLSFSLARSRGLVACAVASGCTVGIDVQTIDGSVRACEIARDAFCADETAALAACPAGERPSRFCQLWTLKEALLKAIGTGLGWPLSCASFDVRERRVTLTHLPTFAAGRFAFLLVHVGATHELAIAVAESSAPAVRSPSGPSKAGGEGAAPAASSGTNAAPFSGTKAGGSTGGSPAGGRAQTVSAKNGQGCRPHEQRPGPRRETTGQRTPHA